MVAIGTNFAGSGAIILDFDAVYRAPLFTNKLIAFNVIEGFRLR